MKSELLNACEPFVSAVANGLYQGVIVTVLVGLSLRIFNRTNAATRHAVWFVTLLLLVSIIPAHWAGYYWHPPIVQGNASAPARDVHLGSVSPVALAMPGIPPSMPRDLFPLPATRFDQDQALEKQLGFVPGAFPLPGDELMSRQMPAPSPARPEIALAPLGETVAAELPGRLESSVAPGEQFRWGMFFEPLSLSIASDSRIFRLVTLTLLAVWLATASIKVTLLVWRLYHLRKLKESAFPPSRDLEALFQGLRRGLAVRRSVELRVSLTPRSPLLLGFCHPVILLGTEEAQPTELAAHILRHELAHVRRRDDWANLVQHLIQAVLFFHPAVWWISRQLSLEREIACDDCVLQHVRHPRAYAVLLANLAARIKGCPPMLAPGASTSNSQLKQRISMILNTHRNTSPRLAKTRLGFISTAAALLAVLAFYSAPRLVVAQTLTAPDGASASGGSRPAFAGPIAGISSAIAAEPPEPPEPADAELDDEDSPGSTGPADVEPGPKPKPARPGADTPALAPVPPTPPMALPPSIGYAPAPAARITLTAPRAFALGQAPRSPDSPYDRSSIEKRLERLEKMVQSLLAQGEPKHAAAGAFQWEMHPEIELQLKSAQGQQERARVEAERAADQVKRAAEDIKRTAKENAMKGREEWRARASDREGFGQQLEALRKAREALGREMEHLDRQIERLEQERGRLEQDGKRRNENQDQQRPNKDQDDQPSEKPVPKELRR